MARISKATKITQIPPQKSIWTTYLLWLFGGIFGLHHFYLGRDRQAFIWWATLGGYFGVGWIVDFFKIPEMVRDANEDPEFISKFKDKLREHRKPPFSMIRFSGAFMVAYLFGQMIMIAIPEHDFGGINWSFLHWLIPFGVSLGIWTVGNTGREHGLLLPCLLAAYIAYPIRYFVYDESYWFTAVIISSALVFDNYSKQWLLKPPNTRSMKSRCIRLSAAICLYLALWGCFFYFNGKITDSDGDEVPVHEAITHFFTSPWWTDLKQTLNDTWQYAQHHGWYETWKQIIDTMDADGEQNAYKVLGLLPTASQSEITAAFRKLSRENHPDKIKGEEEKKAAQNRFMEITQSYEILSKIKSKRRQRNKKFTEEEL